ncbi:MAG: HAD-IIIA family hydrolase [Deltaproteobacteria bacterium]|nr:HAD-IIIA family hydrolase [Deltaproteobacteria bacterium]
MRRVQVNLDLARIKSIKLVIFDVDGVLTDGRIVIDDNGIESKFFDVRDGAGLKWLKRAGIELAFLTGRESRVVEHRAKELGVSIIRQGAKQKLTVYKEIIEELGLTDREVAFVGDDLVDLPVLRRVGLAMAPADARPEVKNEAHYICQQTGGRGAAREIAEIILKGQGLWEQITDRYFQSA